MGLAALKSDIAAVGFVLNDSRHIALGFDTPYDLAILTAWYSGSPNPAFLPKKAGNKRRTPTVLKKF